MPLVLLTSSIKLEIVFEWLNFMKLQRLNKKGLIRRASVIKSVILLSDFYYSRYIIISRFVFEL